MAARNAAVAVSALKGLRASTISPGVHTTRASVGNAPIQKERGPAEGNRASDKHRNSPLAPLGKCSDEQMNTRAWIVRHIDVQQCVEHQAECVQIEPDLWQWQFRIGETVKTGKTETTLALLAARRVQLRIDRELKACAKSMRPSRDLAD
jgi:hypothetical protein